MASVRSVKYKIVGNRYQVYATGAIYRDGQATALQIKRDDIEMMFEVCQRFRGAKGRQKLDDLVENYPDSMKTL